MELLDVLLKLLKEKHGKKLNMNNGEVYYLFLKGGLFSVYLDEDEKELKVNIEMLPEDKTYVYHSDVKLDKLMK